MAEVKQAEMHADVYVQLDNLRRAIDSAYEVTQTLSARLSPVLVVELRVQEKAPTLERNPEDPHCGLSERIVEDVISVIQVTKALSDVLSRLQI